MQDTLPMDELTNGSQTLPFFKNIYRKPRAYTTSKGVLGGLLNEGLYPVGGGLRQD